MNITPSSFSVIWAGTPHTTPSISVFSDPGGTTSLKGQVGLEYNPLHSGNPAATNAYDRRLNASHIRQNMSGFGLVHVRVSGCNPQTTYYYRVAVSNDAGQTAVWPPSGPLPAVTTAIGNSFVVQSRQLVISLPGIDASGSIVTLENTNSTSVLAAVAGDGAGNNEVFFSLSDLIAAVGNTNYLPLGNQLFTAKVLANSASTSSQTYNLNFTSDFLVGQGDQISFGQYSVLSMGSTVLRAGATGNIPINLFASTVTNISFTLDLPTNRFASLSLQGIAPQLSAASLQPVSSNRISLSFTTFAGQTLEGNQQIAQLNFVLTSNQPSAFVPFVPASLLVFSSIGSVVTNLAVQSGRLVVIGNEPLLESLLGPSGRQDLALYGKPFASYEIQYTTNLANPAAWTLFLRTPMTNLVQVFQGLDTSQPLRFYRALELVGGQTFLNAQLSGTNRSLLVFGAAGTNYVLQYSTNLSGVVTWYPLLSFTMTNSFQVINNIGNTNPRIFYRLNKP